LAAHCFDCADAQINRQTLIPAGRRLGVRSLHILPEGLTQADVLTVVLALTGIGSVVFRKTAKARIG
jgi:hypothetical protein